MVEEQPRDCAKTPTIVTRLCRSRDLHRTASSEGSHARREWCVFTPQNISGSPRTSCYSTLIYGEETPHHTPAHIRMGRGQLKVTMSEMA